MERLQRLPRGLSAARAARLSHGEIERARIPVGTVKSRLSRARQELASVLRDFEGGGKHG